MQVKGQEDKALNVRCLATVKYWILQQNTNRFCGTWKTNSAAVGMQHSQDPDEHVKGISHTWKICFKVLCRTKSGIAPLGTFCLFFQGHFCNSKAYKYKFFGLVFFFFGENIVSEHRYVQRLFPVVKACVYYHTAWITFSKSGFGVFFFPQILQIIVFPSNFAELVILFNAMCFSVYVTWSYLLERCYVSQCIWYHSKNVKG